MALLLPLLRMAMDTVTLLTLATTKKTREGDGVMAVHHLRLDLGLDLACVLGR